MTNSVFAQQSDEAIGKFVFVIGNVSVEDSLGKTRKVKKGSELNAGDAVVTGNNGMAQIRMIDKAFVSVRKESRFVVDSYNFGVRAEERESKLKLVKGGFRTITGLIGKTNRNGYQLSTPVATLGIRGTDYAVNLSPKGDIFVGVLAGGVTVKNRAGSLDLNPNQYAHVETADKAPRSVLKPDSLLFDSESFKKEKEELEENENTDSADGDAKESNAGKESSTSESADDDTDTNENSDEQKATTSAQADGDESEDDTTSDSTKSTQQTGASDDVQDGDDDQTTVATNGTDTTSGSETDSSSVSSDTATTNDSTVSGEFGSDLSLSEGESLTLESSSGDLLVGSDMMTNTGETSPEATLLDESAALSDVVKDAGTDEALQDVLESNFKEVSVSNTGKRRMILSGTSLLNPNELAINNQVIPASSNSSGLLTGFYITREPSLGSPNVVETISINTAAQFDAGHDPETNLTWGRWAEGSVTQTLMNISETKDVNLGANSLHWISGIDNSEITSLPIEGSASYQLIGNTNPTDNHGNVGVLGSATLDVNFTTQTAKSTLNIGINNQSWSGSANGLNISNGQFSGSVYVRATDNASGSTVVGSGAILGGFVGPVDTNTKIPGGAAMSYQLNAAPAQVDTNVSGVAAFGVKK
ncbi:MAG: FecR domain-containing protein [Gammaproteobacteria bacterium]|nr:FecR domain-containing protein [Gammaproteobacteria bacterium]